MMLFVIQLARFITRTVLVVALTVACLNSGMAQAQESTPHQSVSPNGWSLGTNPSMSVDWEASRGNKLAFPVGLQVGKLQTRASAGEVRLLGPRLRRTSTSLWPEMESSAPNNSASSGIDRAQVMPRNTAMLSAWHQLLISEDVTSPETTMKREISVNSPWRVIIVGGGVGGLRAAQALKSNLFDVTLIDRRNYHLYQPLLGQVAAGSLSPGQISAPLRSVLGWLLTRTLAS
jgi:hypothetical protein